MDVKENLLHFKFHFIFVTLFSIIVAVVVSYSPGALTIFSYFWPLVLSTALFFVAVVVFGRISPPETECSGEKKGAELIDFVAGQPEVTVEEPEVTVEEPEEKVEDTPHLETDVQ